MCTSVETDRYGIKWRWTKGKVSDDSWQLFLGSLKETNEVTPLAFQQKENADRFCAKLNQQDDAEFQVVHVKYTVTPITE